MSGDPLDAAGCERFLVHEARLLDDARFEEWLALFTADAWYWVPTEPDQKDGVEDPDGPPEPLSWFESCRGRSVDRIGCRHIIECSAVMEYAAVRRNLLGRRPRSTWTDERTTGLCGRMQVSSPLGESLRLGRTAILADAAPCRFDASTEPH